MTSKTFFTLGFCSLFFVQCHHTDSHHLRIKGQIEGVKDSLVFMMSGFSNGELVAKDTTIMTDNGAFDLTLPLNCALLLEVFDGATDRNGGYAGFNTLAVPGEELTLTGNIATECELGGSDFYRQLNEAEKEIRPITGKMNQLAKDYGRLQDQGKMTDALMERFSKRGLMLHLQRERAIFKFVKAHPDEEVSAALIHYLDVDSAKKLVKMLSTRVQRGRLKTFFGPIVEAQPMPVQLKKETCPAKEKPVVR